MGLIIPGLTPDTLGEIYEYYPTLTELRVAAGVFALGLPGLHADAEGGGADLARRVPGRGGGRRVWSGHAALGALSEHGCGATLHPSALLGVP